MRKATLVLGLLLVIASGAARAQVPNTRFINLVDTPAAIAFNQFGEAFVQLDPTAGSIINVSAFRKVHVMIGSSSATSAQVAIGKIRGATLAQGFTFVPDGKIHTFEVMGPHFSILLRGPANTSTTVQLWVYLSS